MRYTKLMCLVAVAAVAVIGLAEDAAAKDRWSVHVGPYGAGFSYRSGGGSYRYSTGYRSHGYHHGHHRRHHSYSYHRPYRSHYYHRPVRYTTAVVVPSYGYSYGCSPSYGYSYSYSTPTYRTVTPRSAYPSYSYSTPAPRSYYGPGGPGYSYAYGSGRLGR